MTIEEEYSNLIKKRSVNIIVQGKKVAISIFVKLIAGYFIPILLMGVFGIIALVKSSNGLNGNYQNSTKQAIEMTTN